MINTQFHKISQLLNQYKETLIQSCNDCTNNGLNVSQSTIGQLEKMESMMKDKKSKYYNIVLSSHGDEKSNDNNYDEAKLKMFDQCQDLAIKNINQIKQYDKNVDAMRQNTNEMFNKCVEISNKEIARLACEIELFKIKQNNNCNNKNTNTNKNKNQRNIINNNLNSNNSENKPHYKKKDDEENKTELIQPKLPNAIATVDVNDDENIKDVDIGIISCICGCRFEIIQCSGDHERFWCDDCKKYFKKNDTMYHCPLGSNSQVHEYGYDLCQSCFIKQANSVLDFRPHLTLLQCKSYLNTNCQIDVRSKDGKYEFGTVTGIKDNMVSVTIVPAVGKKKQETIDINVEWNRIAIGKSVSRRAAHRFQHLKVTGNIFIKPWSCQKNYNYDGDHDMVQDWIKGEIVEKCPVSGQVRVKYKQRSNILMWSREEEKYVWVHLDNVDETALFLQQ